MARHLRRQPEHQYTVDEYLALEKAGDRRYEFWDGEIVCMSGGTLAHGQISRNIFRAFDSRIAGGPCQAFTADMAIKTGDLYRYPDASVVCGDAQTEQIHGMEVLVNPVAIVEVLSPMTEDRDRNEKRTAYQAIPSLKEYWIISQDIPHVTHYARDGGVWVRRDYSRMEDGIPSPSVGATLSLEEIYRGVTFE